MKRIFRQLTSKIQIQVPDSIQTGQAGTRTNPDMIKFIILRQKYTWLLVCMILTVCLPVRAQEPQAGPGPDGIFIWFGRKLPIGFQYQVERQQLQEGAQREEIFRSGNLDLNYSVMLGKLIRAGSRNPTFTLPDSLTVLRFINLLKGQTTSDSIQPFNSQTGYIEAMGTGCYDNTASPNTRYEYLVNEIDGKQRIIKTTRLNPDPFPGTTQLERPQFRSWSKSKNSVELIFAFSGTELPANLRIFRQATLQTPFAECFPEIFYRRGPSGLEALVLDSMVTTGVSYRYLAIPVDFIGNRGPSSDTIRIHFGHQSLSPVEWIKADTIKSRIVLKWKSDNHNPVASISVYRSTQFDTGFILLNRIPATDSIYSDQNIKRGTTYYYYLIFNSPESSSPPTAKVMALIDETERPLLAPGSLKVIQTSEGNRLSWERTETDTRGYYLYRGLGYNATKELISSLIVSQEKELSFVDSIRNLIPGETYCYAVSAVNRGNLEGPRSKEVIAEPVRPELPVPLNLDMARRDQGVLLFWNDLSSLSPFITGYRIFRKPLQNLDFDTLSLTSTNSFFDSTLSRGIMYSYAVQSIGIQDSKSTLSRSVDYLWPKIKILPPSGLRATKTSQGVLINWDEPAVDDLRGFKVYREKPEGGRVLIAETDRSTISFMDQPGSAGTYFYTVTSINNQGEESPAGEETGIKLE